MTLVATPGAANANSYATALEGDAYHATRLYSDAWTDADTTTKETALIMATRVLDAMYEWASWVTFPLTQALQWPRVSMLARNKLSYIPNDAIPQDLKNATAELARQLIASDLTADSDIVNQKIRSLTAGPVSLTFGESVEPVVIPDAVFNMLPPWWGYIRGRVSSTRELVRA